MPFDSRMSCWRSPEAKGVVKLQMFGRFAQVRALRLMGRPEEARSYLKAASGMAPDASTKAALMAESGLLDIYFPGSCSDTPGNQQMADADVDYGDEGPIPQWEYHFIASHLARHKNDRRTEARFRELSEAEIQNELAHIGPLEGKRRFKFLVEERKKTILPSPR